MLELPDLLASNEKAKSDFDLSKIALPRTANQRLSDAVNQPPIRKLFGDIWLSGELHLLFADTGVGKSVLGIAIGDALSKGKSVMFLENEFEPLTVLYYDFELSDRQFLKRYSNEQLDCYGFSERFHVDNIDFKELLSTRESKSFEQLLFEKIRYDVQCLNADIVIIDNITYLKTQTTQKTDSALELMRELSSLKRELKISVMVLAHTPKIDSSSPLTINSLAGSKHLSNFADSVSAFGVSELGKSTRYIKQIKVRNAEMMYDARNVIVCELEKGDNMLSVDFIGFGEEATHLKRGGSNDEHKPEREEAKALIEEGKSYSQVAEILLGDPGKKGTIHKWVNKTSVSIVS